MGMPYVCSSPYYGDVGIIGSERIGKISAAGYNSRAITAALNNRLSGAWIVNVDFIIVKYAGDFLVILRPIQRMPILLKEDKIWLFSPYYSESLVEFQLFWDADCAPAQPTEFRRNSNGTQV